MKVEGQIRNINTQQCNEVKQKIETHENVLKPNKEQKHTSMLRKQKLIDVKSQKFKKLQQWTQRLKRMQNKKHMKNEEGLPCF